MRKRKISYATLTVLFFLEKFDIFTVVVGKSLTLDISVK